MSWLDKLRRRKPDHDKWLAAHPGKESTHHAPPAISEEDGARMRSTMERELEESRRAREG